MPTPRKISQTRTKTEATMPEGDTLVRVARTLHRALSGQVVRRFDAAYTPLLRIDEEAPIRGRTVLRVEARGKWCLLWLGAREAPEPSTATRWDGPLILCTHLLMNGMWHIYRADREDPWQRPARDMRVLVATDRFIAVGFRVPIAELVTPDELCRHREISRLGPDLLAESFDEAEALRRLRARGECEIGPALIDQSAVAGLGNVYKSEVCFLIGVDPHTRVSVLSDASLKKALSLGRQLLGENSALGEVVTYTGMRRTTRAMAPSQRLWVYGRAGKPCRRCATPIRESRQGAGARVTFYCPRCQKNSEAITPDDRPESPRLA
jgi:endonuclease-8